MEFKNRLEHAILQNHKNIKQFSDSSKLNDGMIRSYVKGEVNPTIEKVNELAKHLKVSPAWLAYGVQEDILSSEKLDEVIDVVNLIHKRLDEWLERKKKVLSFDKRSIVIKIISTQLQEQQSFSVEAINKQVDAVMEIYNVA
jgi:transcriptional regulator with XRE-family HTH domain